MTEGLLCFAGGGGKLFLHTGLKKSSLSYLVTPHEFTTSLVENSITVRRFQEVRTNHRGEFER